jgi:hypothetical protein
MQPQLTKKEIGAIEVLHDGHTQFITNEVADAQLRKALWWTRDWLNQFGRDHASIRLLDGKLKDMGIEQWVSDE